MTDEKGNNGTQPAHDLVEKIDVLIDLLKGWRATIVQIGDPRPTVAELTARAREMIPAVLGGKGEAITTEELVVNRQLLTALTPAATARDNIERAVDRLHAAVPEPPPSDEEIRDRLARYLDSLIEKIRWDVQGRAATPAAVANWMIAAITTRWSAYGNRLERHRSDLTKRMGELATRNPKGGRARKGQEHAQTAAGLREEILSWMFQAASPNTIGKYRKRQEKSSS